MSCLFSTLAWWSAWAYAPILDCPAPGETEFLDRGPKSDLKSRSSQYDRSCRSNFLVRIQGLNLLKQIRRRGRANAEGLNEPGLHLAGADHANPLLEHIAYRVCAALHRLMLAVAVEHVVSVHGPERTSPGESLQEVQRSSGPRPDPAQGPCIFGLPVAAAPCVP